jgi:hypothetical protein
MLRPTVTSGFRQFGLVACVGISPCTRCTRDADNRPAKAVVSRKPTRTSHSPILNNSQSRRTLTTPSMCWNDMVRVRVSVSVRVRVRVRVRVSVSVRVRVDVLE